MTGKLNFYQSTRTELSIVQVDYQNEILFEYLSALFHNKVDKYYLKSIEIHMMMFH